MGRAARAGGQAVYLVEGSRGCEAEPAAKSCRLRRLGSQAGRTRRSTQSPVQGRGRPTSGVRTRGDGACRDMLSRQRRKQEIPGAGPSARDRQAGPRRERPRPRAGRRARRADRAGGGRARDGRALRRGRGAARRGGAEPRAAGRRAAGVRDQPLDSRAGAGGQGAVHRAQRPRRSGARAQPERPAARHPLGDLFTDPAQRGGARGGLPRQPERPRGVHGRDGGARRELRRLRLARRGARPRAAAPRRPRRGAARRPPPAVPLRGDPRGRSAAH